MPIIWTITLCMVWFGCARTAAQPAALEAPVQAMREAAQPIRNSPEHYDPLLKSIAENRFVLLGESTI